MSETGKTVGEVRILGDIDIVILAGGLGTRVRSSLGDTPKVMAPINGRPFIDHLLDRLTAAGARRIILSLGHLADKVVRHVRGQPGVETVIEPEPLGTAGAIRFLRNRLLSDNVLVINGDTWLEVDIDKFLLAHLASGTELSIVGVHVDDVSRYGHLELAADRILRFVEKDVTNHSAGLINGGIYLITQAALDALDSVAGRSLEQDFFFSRQPESIHCFVQNNANFIDIGTPESLQTARSVMPDGKC
ncbi:MAG: NTP transferase domain-containing protein [Rhodospirillaceae bacterium]|jgi:NDP-sugar pyrophosphorylase family protein|nr:NTP transferase domain-containing protein [Rhodospirillaceae bacterium]MBT5242866.1 NTP transferase domain-containing protein [Rhodospirillaceae bacterium]MBT5563090.1 NTP transferase domain-containing protein [Rhodospirillaceae bacterium]MBT6243405.1 NTP transferase domain-containing protein [Rhodospirillaceae bacterium]